MGGESSTSVELSLQRPRTSSRCTGAGHETPRPHLNPGPPDAARCLGVYLMRLLGDILRQSLATLWAHKLRSFLTMFGIAWGVGSLLLLVGLGEGFRSGQEKQLATLGQNIMFMFPGRIPAVEGSTQSGQLYYFTYKDYLAIRNEAQLVGALSPVLNREDIRAVSDYGSTNGQVFGVASDYNQIRNVPVEPGRWFNSQDNSERRRVAVVGWELLKNMFPGRPAVGSTIHLNGISF